jgi:ATP-dependent helicase HrpA
MQIGSICVAIEYNFTPGDDSDGVTFRLPIGVATTVSPEKFDWLVPGLFREKLLFLLKALPKSLRKKLVPVSDSVNRIFDDLEFGSGALYPKLESSIFKLFGFQINRSDWTTDLPLHITPRFVLIDEKGQECFSGRNLRSLTETSHEKQTRYKGNTQSQEPNKALSRWNNSEHSTWNFSDLPQEITLRDKGGTAIEILYPALQAKPEKSTVKIIFIADYRKAQTINSQGHLLLFRLQFPEPYKALKKLCSTMLSGPSILQLMPLAANKKELTDLFLEFILTNLFPHTGNGIIKKEQFDQCIQEVKEAGFFKKGQEIAQATMSLLRQRREIVTAIEETYNKSRKKGHRLPTAKDEFYASLEAVFPISYLTDKAPLHPQTIERHLRGLKVRLERFYVDPEKDRQKALLLTPYLNQLKEIQSRDSVLSQEAIKEIEHFQTMINEYRLVLFSPEIRGSISVSPKKLNVQWKAVQSLC